jgi:hypothetical protein
MQTTNLERQEVFDRDDGNSKQGTAKWIARLALELVYLSSPEVIHMCYKMKNIRSYAPLLILLHSEGTPLVHWVE